MPWQETDPVLERHHFAHDLANGHWAMTELSATATASVALPATNGSTATSRKAWRGSWIGAARHDPRRRRRRPTWSR